MASLEELAARLAGVEARLADAEAVLAIQNLKARYGSLVDARYGGDGPRPPAEVARLADEIAALFAEDAVWDGGQNLGVWRGRAAIRERFLEPTLRFTLHYFVKPCIEVAGDRARARWDILAPVRFQNGKPGWMAGVEDDEYVREAGTWLHSRMRLLVHFMAPHAKGW